MASFTTRVELHDENADYDDLHEAMKKRGFSRTIVGRNGTYHLPNAEYDYESGSETAEDVRKKASEAAATVTKNHGVLVTEVTRRVWLGLTEV
ncbi:DUF2622 domain-containing protein [Burkholderia sp. Bp9099]|uniref:DUF2622 domain-containing protein n=1 Tax=Burkholderia sp. Bp9099 TaxID=2184568 RepID=UPI000F602C93|nr:DUF2622 domain-containing protein [Burkholderia sp. Bp9099]RQZ40052.1 DUF2622 domain-containing protein [Burkholderia sp. Bp9099]